ncbi:MAG: hypothetical protein LBS92_02240 [Candidatus Methanoplasma sp.]|jgi:hypothetical protein|nr:hypothetical protein [Candidatus Methanoplasma sp.]
MYKDNIASHKALLTTVFAGASLSGDSDADTPGGYLPIPASLSDPPASTVFYPDSYGYVYGEVLELSVASVYVGHLGNVAVSLADNSGVVSSDRERVHHAEGGKINAQRGQEATRQKRADDPQRLQGHGIYNGDEKGRTVYKVCRKASQDAGLRNIGQRLMGGEVQKFGRRRHRSVQQAYRRGGPRPSPGLRT